MTQLLIAATLAVLVYGQHRMHLHLTEHIDRQTKHLEGVTTMSNQDAINTITAQLTKAKTEISNRIADLQAQIAAGVPSEQLDLSSLTAAAQALDDLNPDTPPADDQPTLPTE